MFKFKIPSASQVDQAEQGRAEQKRKYTELETNERNPTEESSNSQENQFITNESQSISTSSSSIKPSYNVKQNLIKKIQVHPNQNGNRVLKHITKFPFEFGEEMEPDFLINDSTCVLFLTCLYHRLHPDYIYDRMKKMTKRYKISILLLQVDVDDYQSNLRELTKLCILSTWTLYVSFSAEEAAKYLELFKLQEQRPTDKLKPKIQNEDHLTLMTQCLCSIKGVNKTDVMTLMTVFGSMENIMKASKEEILNCPGFGAQKAKRIWEIFNKPL